MGRIFARRRPLILFLLFVLVVISHRLHQTWGRNALHADSPEPPSSWAAPTEQPSEDADGIGYLTKPRTIPSNDTHPVEYISEKAHREFSDTLRRQSKTLEQAVEEYRRRYGLPPPPRFDKWFEFAQENEVRLIDEFDTIHDLMTPFWGLSPKTIRGRAREALGHGNGLIGIAIRGHKVAFVENPSGAEWQHLATIDMMGKFIQHLPDMDLAFNIHDEPRVVLQHDDLARLVHRAKTVDMSASRANPRPVNRFSTNVPDLGGLQRFEETRRTRFRSAAHQPTWTTSRMSCPPDSAARILEDDGLGDDAEKYAATDAGFVYNSSAMADICLSPSLSTTFGFFDMPNGYVVAHDLFPIFSQSKISSYSDIIYPSPWYWAEKVAYNETRDPPWADKQDRLYWRGSTTGGFSRDGNWKRHHRQRLVRKINHGARAKIVVNRGRVDRPEWAVSEVNRSDFEHLADVRFSHVGQCDPRDCQSQIKFFGVKDMVDMQDAWGYKFLLDMDGNAFSGRFYAFLRSRSLVFKQALFQEWHREWLRPWVHYVPVSMRGHDWLELVRYYDASGEKAEAMAKTSTEWAGKAVRKVDLEAWFFRLLLEYARVIDDDRAVIGFDLPGGNPASL